MSKSIKKEASVVANVKGHMGGAGWPMKNKKGKHKKNPSKPFGEASLFENAIALSLLGEEDFDEVVRKRGESWIFYDDETEAQVGVYPDREAAWERQRMVRKQRAAQKKAKSSEKERQKQALTPTLSKEPDFGKKAVKAGEARPERPKKKDKPKTAKKPKRVSHSKVYKAEAFEKFKNLINERSMISYVFENSPSSDESTMWDSFLSKLSKQTIMSDSKLKAIIQKTAKFEAMLLNKAIDEIKGVLEPTGSFKLLGRQVEQDPETGDVMMSFKVHLNDNDVDLAFGVKLENGRPLVVFPEQARTAINKMANDESKLLRAELMHTQETILDHMDDVINVNAKRDMYLKKMEEKLDKLLDSLNLVELSMLRFLLKGKYKGIK